MPEFIDGARANVYGARKSAFRSSFMQYLEEFNSRFFGVWASNCECAREDVKMCTSFLFSKPSVSVELVAGNAAPRCFMRVNNERYKSGDYADIARRVRDLVTMLAMHRVDIDRHVLNMYESMHVSIGGADDKLEFTLSISLTAYGHLKFS